MYDPMAASISEVPPTTPSRPAAVDGLHLIEERGDHTSKGQSSGEAGSESHGDKAHFSHPANQWHGPVELVWYQGRSQTHVAQGLHRCDQNRQRRLV